MKRILHFALVLVVLTVLYSLSAHLLPAGVLGAMATTATTDIDEAMKVIFAEPLIDQTITDSELMAEFEGDTNVQTEETTGGRYIEMANLLQLPSGVGARAEGDYLPVPRGAAFKNTRVYLRKIMGVVEMTGDTMDRVRHDEGAFLNYSEQALPLLVENLKNDLDRQYAGFGAGIKARTTGTPVGPDVNGYYALGLKDSLGILGFEDPWLQFIEGDSIVFSATPAGTALKNPGTGQAAVVVGLDEDTNTLTLSMAAGLAAAVAASDYIFNGDSAGSSSQASGVDRELSGLLAAIDDGNIVDVYQNIDRTASDSRLFRSIVIDGGAAPWAGAITEDLLVYADDVTRQRGGGKPDLVVMSLSAARGYWKTLRADRIFPDPKAYAGGMLPLSVRMADRVLSIKTARKLPPQVVFGVQRNTFKRYHLGQWIWDDKTGSIWNRVTDGTGRKDAFYAVGKMYEQLCCTASRKNFRIDGLSKVS